ncbi:hypothetical protein [Actinomycetospora straminea]|uniref:Uncharacterized protein n=1 Tax=Actinomycetospora straminea TaxID=663607 RepID=A0ABP9EDH5_9PSEU|nr:hypothetical protein [Actinomycetospora straminea]MDD7932122.1 hypothetical protein [Actinomycetospora straminea]
MRIAVVTTVTVILLLGAVPLAVPGVPRLHGVPPLVALGVLVLAGVALVVGLALLALGRRAQRRDEAATADPAVRPAPEPAPVPTTAPAAAWVTVRTRW